MADIKRLAQSARDKYAKKDALTMGAAIRKAIIGSGVRHEPDVQRLMKAVGKQVYADEQAASPSRRRA